MDIFDAGMLAVCLALVLVSLFVLAKAAARRERGRVLVMLCSTLGVSVVGYSTWLGIKSTEHVPDLRCLFLGGFIIYIPDISQWITDKIKRDNANKLTHPPKMP